jgi:hypothetical protein
MAYGKDQFLALVNTLMNLRALLNIWKLLSG